MRYGYNEQQYKRYRSHAWRSLLLFSLLYCAHYCCRLNLANAQVAMTEFTSEDIGILTSALFWCYGFGHLINGRLGEMIGVRRFIILSIVLSVVANFVMGFQTSLLVMAIVWGFNGFFQSMAWSPGISVLNQWWPSGRRGFAVGCGIARYGLSTWIPKYFNDVAQLGPVVSLLTSTILPIGVVWALAANIGGRVFGSTSSGVLDWATYMGASVQASVYGSLLASGNRNVLFISVFAFCVVFSMLSFIASKASKNPTDKNAVTQPVTAFFLQILPA